MSERKSIPKNLSLYENDLATLHQVGKDMGFTSLSATVRWVIHDWKRMKAQQTNAIAESRAAYTTEPAQ